MITRDEVTADEAASVLHEHGLLLDFACDIAFTAQAEWRKIEVQRHGIWFTVQPKGTSLSVSVK
jgi:hypothetical protein